MSAVVDLWWTPGSELAGPTDTRVNCRAFSASSGLPSGWRTGERARFAEMVLSRYEDDKAAPPPAALARGWRLNSGAGGHVSLSDTGRYYVIGVGRGVPVGIDAEAARPVDDAQTTLRRLGLTRTVDLLATLPPAARNRAFLSIWTAFESFLKLERLAWDEGAKRFAALEQHWLISRDGHAVFRSARAGLSFEHVVVDATLVIGVATPVPAKISVKRANLPLRRDLSSDNGPRRTAPRR